MGKLKRTVTPKGYTKAKEKGKLEKVYVEIDKENLMESFVIGYFQAEDSQETFEARMQLKEFPLLRTLNLVELLQNEFNEE